MDGNSKGAEELHNLTGKLQRKRSEKLSQKSDDTF